MRERPVDQRIPEFKQYADKMIAALSLIQREKTPPTTTQCASTTAILNRDPALDEEWWNRPLPKAQINVDHFMSSSEEERAKLINMRHMDPVSVSHVEATRRRPKNSIGQSDTSATTTTLKEAAVNAFTYSPPATLTFEEKKKLTEMSGYTKPPKPEEITTGRDLKWDEKIFDYFRLGCPPWRKGWHNEEINGE